MSKEQGILELIFKTRAACIKNLKFTESEDGPLPESTEFLKMLRSKNLSSVYDFTTKPASLHDAHELLWNKIAQTLNELTQG